MIPTPLQEAARTAVVALDWANRQHAWALSPSASSRPLTGSRDSAPEAIDHWASGLGRVTPGGLGSVALVIKKRMAVLPDWLRRQTCPQSGASAAR